MFILKKGHQPGVYVPLRALFLVFTKARRVRREIIRIFSMHFVHAYLCYLYITCMGS